MGRVATRGAVVSLFVLVAPGTVRAEAPARASVRLFADTDDDDDDGTADKDEKWPGAVPGVEWLEGQGGRFVVKSDEGSLRVFAGRNVVSAAAGASVVRAKRLGLLGVAPGRATVESGSSLVDVGVCQVVASNAQGRPVDLVTSHASLTRAFPPLIEEHTDGGADLDSLVWTVVCPEGLLPPAVRIESRRAGGEPFDALDRVELRPRPCPPGFGVGLACAGTAPVRASVDDVDRSHPATASTSLRAEVGGRIVVSVAGRKAASIRVGGPRESRVGAIERLRGVLRFHVVRSRDGGGPAIGGDAAGAAAVSRAEARTASFLWGQCGVHFGPEEDVFVEVVPPPPPHLLAVGCDLGAPASGDGRLSFSIDGTSFQIPTRAGAAPVAIAHAAATAIERAGFRAEVSPNARVALGALRTADVLVRRKDGSLPRIADAPDAPLSSDSTLRACVGEVDLGDGLSHFDDLDAAAGTLEERTLVKAYDDGDPTTVDVFVVPTFARSGRIGESFIDEPGSSIQNVVIIDRAGIRASSRSYALSHELGHVLLDLPGHPDDFGIDRPWALMDADAADPTIFGPRRLSADECARAAVQSGPGAAVPLLTAWPLVGPKAAAGRGRHGPAVVPPRSR